jgi:hypothetical protein
VREEISKCGRTNTAETFNRMQAQRKQMIMAQQEKGVLGAMRGLNKLSQDKDISRISKDQMEESKIFTTGKP